MNYIVFAGSGGILRSGICPANSVISQGQAGESAMQGSGGDSTHYVDIYDYFTIKPKTESPATISGQTISNIHNPSRLICAELGVDEEITEGEVVLNIDTPGIYQFTVRSVPFLDKTFEVIV
jgi:hypothetical protein